MVRIFVQKQGTVRQIHPQVIDDAQPSGQGVTVRVIRERLFVQRDAIALVWDTECHEYVVYLTDDVPELIVCEAVVAMFGEWKCDMHVVINWDLSLVVEHSS